VSRNYPDNVRNADFDEEPDYLYDKPEGFCPWCGTKLLISSAEEWTGFPYCPKVGCKDYDSLTIESENREQYARGREEEAKIQERINRELARRGQ
jgi:hypothetical protein